MGSRQSERREACFCLSRQGLVVFATEEAQKKAVATMNEACPALAADCHRLKEQVLGSITTL